VSDSAIGTVPESSSIRPKVGRSSQASAIANGRLLPGVDQRSTWCRRAKECLAEHLAEKPNASAGEQAIIRRASVLIVELERMERQFALAGEADLFQLEVYARVSSSMRRLLEAVGLRRRPRDVTTLATYLANRTDDEAEEND
jgi:hypothetical protein